MRKVYVTVRARIDKNGNALPYEFEWEDGETYKIDRVLNVRHGSSLKAEGGGIRYEIRVEAQRSYLWREEDDRWYVEAKQ